jgi:hypothetical protein
MPGLLRWQAPPGLAQLAKFIVDESTRDHEPEQEAPRPAETEKAPVE